MKIKIDGRLDGLNEYTKACRGNRYGANTMKKRNEKKVIDALNGWPKIKEFPVKLKITWYEKNKRRDIDNITFATKFIQDALVKAEVLPDDSQKYINAVEHKVFVDKENPRVEIEIIKN